MISINLIGGLGNQLFQIFAAIAYVMDNHEKLVFPEYKSDIDFRPTYWDTLLKRLKDGVDPKLKIEGMAKVSEEGFHYTQLPKKTNVMLVGYFQSYKYFEKQFEAIYKKLNFKMEQELIKNKYLTLNETISLHFRIGDYTTLQLHHNILKDDYYISAISELIKRTKKSNWNIIYFCEEKDNVPVKQRMRKIKKSFPDLTFYKAEDNMTDWEQLLLMSCSDHNIIANSAFSWWAAYLNQNTSKLVCYPKTWFGAANDDKNTKDLCPPSWISI
jgi:hypothetical protein